MGDDDDDLVAAIRASLDGDVEAFAIVVEHCEPFVRAWLATRCPPGVEIDEIAQRGFIAAFRRLDTFRERTPFRAWLLGIVRRELANERRAAMRRYRQQGLAFSARVANMQEDASTGSGIAVEALKRCLRQLDDAGRVLVRQRYEQELSIAAIARAQQRPEGTIKRRLHQLREWLRRCVRRRAVEEGA